MHPYLTNLMQFLGNIAVITNRYRPSALLFGGLTKFPCNAFNQSDYLGLAKNFGVPVMHEGACNGLSQMYDHYSQKYDDPITQMKKDIQTNANDFFKELFIRQTQQTDIIEDIESIDDNALFRSGVNYEVLIKSLKNSTIATSKSLGIAFNVDPKTAHIINLKLHTKATCTKYTLVDTNYGEYKNLNDEQLLELMIEIRAAYTTSQYTPTKFRIKNLSNLQLPTTVTALNANILDYDDRIEYCIDKLNYDAKEVDIYRKKSVFASVVMRHNFALADKLVMQNLKLLNDDITLQKICEKGDTDALDYLVKLHPINKLHQLINRSYRQCISSSYYNTGKNEEKIMEYMLQTKILNPNAEYENMGTSYFTYLFTLRNYDLIKTFLRYGADRDICPISGKRTLYYAIQSKEALQALFESGCDPRVIYKGETLLQIAQRKALRICCVTIIEEEIKLRESGASI